MEITSVPVSGIKNEVVEATKAIVHLLAFHDLLS